ncbi:Pupal cuticle protein Edg-84A [Pseudolycoriella hygida]|uniref:Pupal cuticle protein Edg-84A n=1 Tax=Pseudolycoriella hygida TaxID=35572 RepID=A0A9Q0S962_9DIPT|nr:Pupal cuticle protein Edg-84A [Pseudolycoriella hygida]
MAFKIVLSFALLAIAAAVPVEYKQYSHEAHHDAPAEYEFSYAVHDDHTGDIKSQQESRKGDVVHGRYELIDSDGHKRIVEYTADEHSGFNAVVHREPTDIKIPVYVAKEAHYSHAPQQHYSHAPQQHYSHSPAPAVTHSYVAPKVVAKVVAPVVHHAAAPAPVTHYSHAPAKVEYSHEPAHVTYNAPEYNYHY